MKSPSTSPTPVIKGSPLLKGFRAHLKTPVTALLLACLSMWTVQTNAATYLWDSNTGTTGAQDGAGTWTAVGTTWWNPAGAGSNVAITSGDIGLFGAGGVGGAITLSGNQSLLGMIFGQTATTGYSFTAAAPTTLTLGASGITVLQGAQPVTIGDANLSLVLGAEQTWANRSTGALTLGGGIDNGGFGLTLNGVAGLTTLGQYSLNGALTGAGGLTLSRNASATITANSGYTGAMVIGNASTLTVSGAAGRISGTSGITLNGGNLTMLSATGQQAVDRVNAAAITSNGGTITWTNPAGDAGTWAETLGALSLAKGQTNIVNTNAVSGTQFLTLGTGSLTRPVGSTGTIAFSGTSVGGAQNRIFVTGQANTAANQIIGPWATLGTAAGAQTDYAIYTASGIAARNVATSLEGTWTNSANSYTTTATATVLTATRTPGSLRYNAGAGSVTIGSAAVTAFNLATFGILNGGSGLLTVANGAGNTGGVTTPTGGAQTLYLIGGNNAISVTAPIIDNGTAINVVKSGSGTVTLGNSANSYTGVTTINAGTLTISTTGNGGAASTLGASSNAAANLVIAGGTLSYSAAASTAGSTDRLFTLTEAGGTINNSGSNNNTLTFAGPGSLVASGTGDRTLNLTAGGTGTFQFSPVIVNPGTGTTSLVTSAASTGPILLLPAAANTFTGGITILNRTLQVRTANGWGSNVVSFGTGTTPTLELRSNAAVNFATGFTNGLDFGDNTGIVSLSAVSASNAVTHTIGTVTIGSGTFQLNRGSNLNTNNSSSLTTGAVTLTGNPTFNLNASSGSAAPLLSLGALNDGGVARTITVIGGAAGTGKQYLRLFNNITNFTAGTNIIYSGGNVGGIRLDTANSFGTATNPGLVTFNAPSTVGGVRLLNNAITNFTTNWVLGNNSVLFDLGGTSASQTSKTLTSGTLSIGTSTLTLNGAINNSTNNVYSLALGATTFTGDSTLDVANVNGTAIGSLTLGALDDGAAARTLVKNGLATLQLNTAATNIASGTTLTTTAGITQIGNATAFGSGTLNVGDGTTTGQLRIANAVTLSNNTIVTYLGGTATLGTGSITGPATGTGTINSTINLDAAPGADTGHFQGGGGTLSITGPIVTGGTSGGEVVVRTGNVSLGNATGNTYTSLRVNAGTTTVAVNDAIPTSANIFLADVGATAAINLGTGISQTIASGATWTLGGTGPTLENNVGTIATGTGTLVLNGTLANNTGSLATQLVTGAVSLGGTSGTFNIDSGHATSDMTVSANLSNGSLIKNGAGILTLTGTKTLTDLTINGGAVVGGYGTSGVQTITVGAAGSLQLVNSLAELLTLNGTAGNLNVAGGARIGLELGAPGTSDQILTGVGGTASTSGTITLDFYNLGALAAGTYDLLSATSGLTAGGTTYNVGSAPLGFNYSINATDTLVQLTTTAYTPRFWTDSQTTGLWSTSNAGPVTNWSTDAAGLANSTDVPNSTHTVIFSATSLAGPTITSTVDAAFTIDALQFLAAPAGVTAVNLGQSGAGALTVAPATSSAGIFVDTNAGTATLGAALPYTVGANQTWNVVGGGANGSALVMAGNVDFNSLSVTKSGAGAASLSGTNSGAGTLTLSAGTLNLNSNAALGSAAFTINGGTTLDNNGGGPVTLGTTNAITLNGNFTFTGTQNLSFANNAVSLPTNVSITTTGGNLTMNGVISETGSRSITKLGAGGALTLGGNNSLSGGVNLNAGTLNLANAGALGTGTFTIAGGTLDNTSGGALGTTNNNLQTWNGNFAFAGSNNLNLGTGAVSLGSAAGTSRTVTVTANTLEVGGIISNGAVGTGITKLGNGTLVLSGANTYTGNTVVQAGTLNVTGSITGNTTTSTLTYGTVAGLSTVNVSGNMTLFTMQGASAAGAVSVYNQTAGTVAISPGTTNVQYVSNNATGYGFMNLTGGTIDANNRFIIANGGSAVARVSGTATIDHTNAEYFMVTQNGSLGELTVLSGGSVNHTGSSNPFHTTLNQSNAYGLINLAGGTLTTGAQSIRAGNSTSTTNVTNNNSFVNLASGTMSTGAGFTTSFGGSGTVGNNLYINFAGATVQTSAAVATFIPATSAAVNVNTTLFGAIDNVGTAQDFTGGLTFDTNGFNSTIGQPILGAHNSVGVRQADITTLTGGSGYAGPPVLQFSTAGVVTGGTPASGYAVVSGGAITEIVITNPGTYTSGTTPTVALVGGGGAGASVTLGSLVTSNLAAGITKNGIGNLTLSGTGSSFFGPVIINGGSLTASGGLDNIGLASPLGTGDSTSNATNAASLVLNGGAFATNIAAPTATDRLLTVTELGGALASNNTTAANTITWNNVNAIAYSGTGNRTLTFDGANPVAGTNTFAPLIGDAGGANVVTLNKTGVSNWHLTNAANAYTGGTNIAAGVLTFDAGALGTTGNITYTGSSTLRWGTGTTTDLSSRLFITDTFTGTVDTGANDVIFANAVGTTGGTTGILNKAGTGALTLNAAATHIGGTTLTAGTLNLGIAGAVGTGTLTLAGGTLDNTSGSAMTLAGNPAQSWSGNFAFTGTNDLDLGNGAVNLTANRAVTVTANTLTAGGVIGDTGGDFGLTKAGAGTLYLSGINTFGANDAININGGILKIDAESGLGDVTNDVVFGGAGAGTLQVTTGFNSDAGKTYSFTAAGGGTIQVDSGTHSINTALIGAAGTGGLIKTGAGTLALTAASTGYDAIGVGAGGATNVGFRVDAGTLLLASNSNSVVGDNSPASMTMQMNGGNLTIQSDTASIARANLWVSAAGTLTIDNLTAGAGIVQAIGAGTAPQLTMGAGASALNITGGTNVTSGTAVAQFDNATFNVAPTFNLTNPSGATMQLTLGAVTAGANTATFTGDGNLVQSGVWGSTGGGITLGSTYSGLATLSQANTYSGLTTVNGGTLAFSTSGNLGDASATNDITLGGGLLQFTPATTVDLTANRQINLATGSTSTVEVTSATGVLQVTGGFATTAASNLTKTGLGTLEVTGALDLNGGNLSVNAGTMRSGLATNGVGALSIANGATLNMFDSATSTANLTGLTLAAGSNLGFDLNAPGVNDFLNLTGTPSITSTVSLNFNNLGGLAIGTYDLLTISGGTLNAADFVLGLAPSGFNYGFSTVSGSQTLRLTASTLNLVYWTGDQDGNWNTNNAADTNWASNATGATDLGALPVATDTLVFSATNANAPLGVVTTSLNNVAVTADSLRFISAPTTPATTTVTVTSGGASGTLTINPQSANNGITVAGLGGDVTLSAPVVAAANQTWEVDGTAPSSLVVSGDVTFTGSVTKTGAGALTLSGTNNLAGTGGVNLVAGTLNIGSATALGTGTFTIGNGTTFTNSTAGALTLSTNNLQTWGGSFTFGGSQNLDLGTGAVTLGNSLTATVSNVLTVGGAIGDGLSTFALTKSGTGTLVLDGDNTYDGLTNLTTGTLTLGGDNSGADGGVTMAATTTLNIDNNNALGATAGTFTINGGTINNTSGSAVVNAGNNAQNWNSSFVFTGTNALDLGTGDVTLSVTPTVTVSASTLTVGGVISGAFGLTKDGAGTLVLSGLSSTAANNYSGTTTVDGGTTTITTTAALSAGLTVGATNTSTNISTLDLSSGSATFGGNLLVQTNSPTANTITIGAAQTLTVNGNVSVSNNTNNAVTNLTMSGGGALVVNGASFTVGSNTTGTNNASQATLNLSALGSFNATVTGTFAVQLTGDNNAKSSSLVLSNTANVITAAALGVGLSSSSGTQSLVLGNGTNAINANTINVGTGGRDAGSITFASAAGSVIIRDTLGTGPAAFNVGTGAATTGATATNTVDFAGHSADLLLSTLTIGGQNRNGAQTNTFSFDTGTLDATTVVVGDNGGTASGASNTTWSSTLNIGGGTTTIGTGGLEIARGDTAVGGSDTVSGTVNISGGTVTIANSPGLGAAVRLGNNTIAPGASVLTTTGLLNITGGTVTVSGNIIKGATTGPGSATITLDGGTLDMSNNSIGAAGALAVTLNAQQGTLQNLNQLNGGGPLTKSTAGTLIMQGTHAYTGGTAINGGILQANSSGGNSLGTTGNISFGGGTLQYTANDTTDYSARIVNSTADAVKIDTNGQTVTFATSVAASNTSGLTKLGTGTLTFTAVAASAYTGNTAIQAGTLQLGNGGADGRLSTASTISVDTTGTFKINQSDTVVQGTDFSGAAITGAGKFEQAGGGITTLNLANLYQGGTDVTGGTLLVNNTTGSGTGTGAVIVTGATLGGNGTLAGATTLNASGILAAGAAASTAGTLTLESSLTLAGSGSPETRLLFDYTNATGNVGSTPAGWWTTYSGALLTGNNSQANDLMNLTATTASTLNWNTGGKVTLNQMGSAYTWILGDVLNLMDWTSLYNNGGPINGTFDSTADFDLPSLSSGLAWDTTRFVTTGAIAVVPEPSRVLLLFFGLFGLCFRRRR